MTTILVHESASSARNLPYWMVLISSMMRWSDFNEHKVRLINRSSCNNIVKFLNKDVKRSMFQNNETNGTSNGKSAGGKSEYFQGLGKTTHIYRRNKRTRFVWCDGDNKQKFEGMWKKLKTLWKTKQRTLPFTCELMPTVKTLRRREWLLLSVLTNFVSLSFS